MKRGRPERWTNDGSGPAGPIVVGALNADLPIEGGIQRYGVSITRALLARDPEVVAYTASPRVAADQPGRSRLVRPEVMAHGTLAGNAVRLGWSQLSLPRRLRRDGASVYYSTVPDGMLAPACPQVVTVHDLIPLLFPESAPRLRYYFEHVVPRLIRASDAVVTMSEATRSDLRERFGVEGDRVHVVHQGYRADVFRPVDERTVQEVCRRFGLSRYLLAVGELRPYKNIRRLMEAFARIGSEGVELALVGRPSPRAAELQVLATTLGIQDQVRFLGYLGDDELAALYAGAEAFVFPSLYEGFGIPPLEAMACGCPVIASDRASIPEVCGDAALYVDPQRVESIAEGIERVLGDEALRRSLRARGLERASNFSYGAAAKQILEVLRACATQRVTG